MPSVPATDYSEQYAWVTIDDFRPGIYSKRRQVPTSGTVQSAPLGAAQASGTFKCIALSDGGLAPLPGINATFDITLPDIDANASTGYFNINGFTSFGPVGPGPSGTVDDWFLGIEYLKTGGTQRIFTLYRIDPVTGTNPYPVDTLVQVTSTSNPTLEQYQGMSFGVTRMSQSATLVSGAAAPPYTPVLITSYAPPGYAANQHVWSFPNPSTPSVTGVLDLTSPNRPTASGETNVGDIICHQNRVIILEYGNQSFGARSGDSIPTNELVSYSDPPLSFNQFGGGSPYTIGIQLEALMSEFPNGYGAYGSISNGELFLIKHQGGGVIVSGDLNSSTLFRLPGVTGCGGTGSRSSSTPIGLVYYSRFQGVYTWNGSNTSEKLSSNLSDDFCWPLNGSDKLLNMHVQFQSWGEWLVASGGWLYDTENKGWWMLDNPSTYTPQWFSQGYFADNLYAVPLRATNAAGAGTKTGFIRNYNRFFPATSYQWTSQPIVHADPSRIIDVDQIVVEASGSANSTIVISIQNLAGTFDTYNTLTLGAAGPTTPQRFRLPANTKSYELVVRAVATSSSGAPIIHSISIGYDHSQLAVTT